MGIEETDILEYHRHAIQVMADYNLYDYSSDKEFEPILDVAKFVCDCPIAFIAFNDNSWQSVRYTSGITQNQLPLKDTVCQFTILKNDFLEIPNVLKNANTKELFKKKKPGIIFYAGVPLTNSDKKVLGTLCVCDTQERKLNANQVKAFRVLATQVVNNLELRKLNQEEVTHNRKNEELNHLFNSSPDLICMLDENLKIININHAVEDILGYSEEECIGLNIAKFIHADDIKAAVKTATTNLKKKVKKLDIEARVVTKDKSIRWMDWNAVTKNRVWFITGRDITQDKETLSQLNQLSTVASKINNGVVISDANNQVIWVNNAFTSITGYTLDDLEFQKLGDVIVGENSNVDIIEKARQETQNKKSFSVELLAYRKDGQPIWLSIFNTIILDKNGEVESLIEIVIDITERKKTEEQLQLLSLVASKTENGVSISDKTGRTTWLNESLTKILGYSFEELKGKRIGDVVKGPDTDVKRLNEARSGAKKHIPYNIELKVYKKDKTPVWVSVSNTPVYDENGNIDREIEIINDITERKKAEEQLLEAKEQALQLSKAKEMFLSVMSHEIRTPLNAVIGLTNILLEEEKLEHQLQTLNLLKFSSDNLLNLINDILDFSKIEVGKMELEKKRLNVKELIKDIADSLSFKVNEKGIAIKYFVANDVPELVRGDKTRLYQILINLINNAIKFTEQGYVKISVRLKSIEEHHTFLHFEVEDTGIGIPEDKFDYVFESFTQAASNTARKYGGTGLGLSITKKLIELYGGQISLSSKLGEGTIFYFDLKFDNFKDSEKQIIEQNTNQKLEMKAKVLVVDDNEINRILAKKVLSKYEIECFTAEGGIEAIERLKEKDIDVVLMDIHMPDMTGYEVVEKLRAIEEEYYKNLPIIALTASIMHDDIETIYAHGMNDFQLKPFKPDELIGKISKYIKAN